MKTVILHKGKESSLLRRHRWVFSGAIARTSEQPKNGETVRVETGKAQFLGIGHYHNGSIAVRMLTFKDEAIDQDFWNNRLQDALDVRKSIGLPNADTNCFRLVHAEGDGLPGCVIDVYSDCAVVQSHTDGMANEVEQIAKALENLSGLELKTVYHRNLAHGTNEFLRGNEPEGICLENGLQFKVNWVEGQKTGFFLDQRDNRALVGSYSNGRSVLNTFCYTGGFSVYALANQAKKVVSVDVSQTAVDLAAENATINGFAKNHEAVCEDTFKYLERTSGFDLIILDPPAFAKSIKARHRAVQGYKRLNETALKKIEPNGLLFTFSCSQVVSPEMFEKTVLSAAINAGRNVRVLKRLGHAADHPVNIFHPEGEYLKGLMLHVS
ncbi:MAG: class I SAM-dependent rRNA methyltransferase [Flavobacteriales bacterium]|nr:class I SAM-dependent rRNA methyltransferase [Flavobacteriales bacterium]MCB9192260.1 class I SAM-dependent rRNA methyltransferase [Flavobacteriales bacterium]